MSPACVSGNRVTGEGVKLFSLYQMMTNYFPKRWDQFTLFLRDKSLPLPTTSPPLGNVRLQICQSNWVCNGISIPIFPITDEFECLWHIISLLGYNTSSHSDHILESLSLLSAGELLLILQHPVQMRPFG